MPDTQDLEVGHAVYYPFEKAVGLIYRTYTFVAPGKRPGVSLLLADGRDIGDFSAPEADKYLVPLGSTGLRYHHKDVGQLLEDYRRGYFAEAFHHAEVLFISYRLNNPLTK
jgi:hypothetical protein